VRAGVQQALLGPPPLVHAHRCARGLLCQEEQGTLNHESPAKELKRTGPPPGLEDPLPHGKSEFARTPGALKGRGPGRAEVFGPGPGYIEDPLFQGGARLRLRPGSLVTGFAALLGRQSGRAGLISIEQ
jgi:hypothetical protein